ncbi:hypothetical protein B0H14DRAFT_2633236 [Mycena olivaceomarginata]|nr:hypothetical protein B0H14DRAFT_2633236 [Mycena olivaceomarginata]
MFFSSFIEIFWRLGCLADASNLTRALPDASERTQYQVPPPGCWNYFYAMYGVIPGHGWCPQCPQSRLLDPCAPRRALAYPNPVSRQMPPSFFFAPCAVPFLDAGGSPGRGWYPPRVCGAACSPRALPDAHQRAQVPPPKTHRQKKNCDLIGAVPGRGGTTRVFGALSSNPCSPAEPPAPPERSQTRIGVPKSHPQKHTANFFFFATSSVLFPDAGGTTRVFEAFRSTPRASSHASASGGFPNSRCQQYPRKVRGRGFTRTYILLLRQPRACGGRRRPRRISSSIHHAGFPCPSSFKPHLVLDSLALSRISLAPCQKFSLSSLSSCTTSLLPPTFLDLSTTSWTQSQSFPLPSALLQPCSLPQQPSTTPGRDEPVCSQSGGRGRRLTRFSHQSNKAKFLTYRATRPYAKEGPGWCYNVTCAADIDIAQHAAGTLTDGAFLARMKWKVGHTNDWQRRQRKYRGCDVGKTHIWICGWEVSRRYYCECLAQLEELCDGGERATIDCVCGVSHREYFSFATSRHRGLRLHVGGGVDKGLMGGGPPAAVLKNKGRTKPRSPCWPDPRAVPTKAIHWPDEDDMRLGFHADKSDVRVYFSADKGDVRAGSYADKGDVPLGLFTDKDDVLTKLHADKDSTHKARRGPSWGCHAGHGMCARRAAA